MAEIAAGLGKPLMPWQSQVINVAMEIDPVTFLPVYRVVRVAVPRQSGKTTLVLVLEVDRCHNWGDMQHCSYTAQDRNNARAKWEEQAEFLARSVLKKQFSLRRQTGLERTLWKQTGSTIGITASGETSGHGWTVDLAIVDEAWAQKDERLAAAFRPAMMTRRSAQEWWLSTMGTEESVPWNDRVDDGRLRVERQIVDPSERHGVAYFEWSAPDEADPYDEETWWGCMPALGRTVDVETVRTDATSMPEADFRRGYLNQRTVGGKPVIEPGRWPALRDDTQTIGSPLAFGADVTPDRAFGAIGAASRTPDGRIVVELVDHRPGASWIPERLAELAQRWQPVTVVVDKVSPAGQMTEDLRSLGITMEATNAGTYAGACGAFYDAIMDGEVTHRGQLPLDTAVAAARKRNIGDTWCWARRVGMDMSPLVAVTLARHGLVSQTEGWFVT